MSKEWLEAYEKLANEWDSNLPGKQKAYDALEAQLREIENDTDPRHTFGVDRRELARWRSLLEKLHARDGPVYGGGTFVRPPGVLGGGGSGGGGDAGGGGSSSNSSSSSSIGDEDGLAAAPSMQQQQMMLKEQDLIVGEIGRGMDRLYDRAVTIKDESSLHIKLLDGIDTDVDHAMNDLRSETARANAVRRTSSNCPYYVTIVVLLGVLCLLIILSW